MQRKTVFLLGILLFVLAAASMPGWGMIQSGIAQYGNNAHITFAQPFNEVPVVVTSGQSGGAVMVGAANNSKTGFDLKIRDLNNNPISSGVWVQWIAATYEPGIQLGLATYNDGQSITFPSPLPGCTILTSGQKDGVPYIIGAVSNSNTGCGLSIRDHAGNPGSGVWVQWIAVTPKSDWRCGVAQYNDGGRLSFPAMSSSPVIFTSGQSGGAVSIGGVANSTTGCALSIRNHAGQAVQGAWTQWWAVKSGLVSSATSPVPPTPVQPDLPATPTLTQPTTTTGPVSTDVIIYLNSPRFITTANFGGNDGSKYISSGGWSDYNKPDKYCRSYSIGSGFVVSGGASSFWSKVGQTFTAKQGSYGSTSRPATIKITGDYSGRVYAAMFARAIATLRVVVTDNGTQVAEKQIFNKDVSAVGWSNFSGNFSEPLAVTLKANHNYCVFLDLATRGVAAIAGSAGADMGEGASRARYSSIDITY